MSNIDLDLSILDRVSERVAKAGVQPAAPRPRPAARPEPVQPELNWNLPGILGPTRVSTTFGEVPAHLVRPRDRLRTREGGYLPVLRIDEYKLDEEFLVHQPDAKPVVIKRGALDGKIPFQDVMFSPGQTVLNPGSGVRLDPIAAREISPTRYAFDKTMGSLCYYVFHVAKPALVRCEGVWVRIGD